MNRTQITCNRSSVYKQRTSKLLTVLLTNKQMATRRYEYLNVIQTLKDTSDELLKHKTQTTPQLNDK